MSRRTRTLVLLLGVMLVALVAWAGWRASQAESARITEQFHQVLLARLEGERSRIDDYFARLRQSLQRRLATADLTPAGLRELVREEPLVRGALLLARDGSLLHPNLESPLSQAERELIHELREPLLDRDLVRAAFPNPPRSVEDGWYTWYFGRGAHLLYWRVVNSEQVVVVMLARTRWMGDLLNSLPHASETLESRAQLDRGDTLQLIDGEQHVVYQWGSARDVSQVNSDADLSLREPIPSWRLRYFASTDSYPRIAAWPRLVGLVTMTCALLITVLITLREIHRDLREAGQRITFVNQVSHELKTPLTNIRLYADLLENDLSQLNQTTQSPLLSQAQERLQVIVDEGQRLTRLITNVLTLARDERHPLQPRWQNMSLDALAVSLLDQFRPAFEAASLTLEINLNASDPISTDPDLAAQILGNLLANVERHASDGGWVGIKTEQTPHMTQLTIRDRGPGIPASRLESIFEPFQPGDRTLHDTRGTGIGLSIARRLAGYLHGDLRAVAAQTGAHFVWTLPGPASSDSNHSPRPLHSESLAHDSAQEPLP